MSAEYPDLDHFEQFVEICKRQGLMHAEYKDIKIDLPPPALNLAPVVPKPGPGETNLRPDMGKAPYTRLFPGGNMPDFPKKPDAKVEINYDELP